MRFWISRGRKGGSAEDEVFFEPTKPKDDGRVLNVVCYKEFRRFSTITLKPGESIEIRTGRKFRWQKSH